MNITLKPEQERFIQQKLQSGEYQSVDDVITEALHLLEERDLFELPRGRPEDNEQWITEVREKIDAAAASLDRGEGLDGEEVVKRILDRFHQAHEA